jgi:predicted nucleic-acid-binding protein
MVKTKKIFLDTNFWVRYFTRDNQSQYLSAVKLIEKVESGRFRPFISSIIFLELNFILSHLYSLNPKQINHCFDLILSLRNLVIVNKTDFLLALKWHRQLKIKLSDCLIASSLPPKCVLISWDKDFSKIKDIQVKTSEDFLKTKY